jgi:hypothetical protein
MYHSFQIGKTHPAHTKSGSDYFGGSHDELSTIPADALEVVKALRNDNFPAKKHMNKILYSGYYHRLRIWCKWPGNGTETRQNGYGRITDYDMKINLYLIVTLIFGDNFEENSDLLFFHFLTPTHISIFHSGI